MKKIMLTFVLVFGLTACSSGSKIEEMNAQQDIIAAQANEYTEGSYTIDNPYVVVDPFELNSLSAYVAFPIENPSTYSYTVEGKDKYSDFTTSSTIVQEDNLIVPVYGLYADKTNKVTIDVLEDGNATNSVEVEIETQPLDESFETFETIDVDTSFSDKDTSYEALEGGLIMSAKGNAYDINGDMRIALGTDKVTFDNGTNFGTNGEFYLSGYEEVYDVDMNGFIRNTYLMEDGQIAHHDTLAASNGNVYVLTSNDVSYEETVENGIYNEGSIAIFKNGKSGYPKKTVDLSGDFVGNLVNSAPTSEELGTDLLHMNSLTYDEGTNTILVSSQSTNMILGLDADSLKIKFTTADEDNRYAQEDKALEQTEDYISTNGQHNIQVVTDPAFDDGNPDTIEYKVFSNYYCVDEDYNSIYTELSDKIKNTCEADVPAKLLIQQIDTTNNTITTLFEQEIEDYRSPTQSSWFTSASNKYEEVAFTNIAKFVVADKDFNTIFEADYDLDINPYGISAYRQRIFTADELTQINDNGLESLLSA